MPNNIPKNVALVAVGICVVYPLVIGSDRLVDGVQKLVHRRRKI